MPAPLLVAAGMLALVAGCASPGPPRPPSLQLPRLVSDLAATRSGDVVTLRFTVPTRTTDGQSLRAATVAGSLCRQLANSGTCTPVDAMETRILLPVPPGENPVPAVWTDPLPPTLRTGPPRAIAYRIELKNAAGRSAGLSDPVPTLAGSAPPPVSGLQAEGTRLGVKLDWQPVANAGEVLLERSEPVATAVRAEKPAPVPGRGRPAKPAHLPAGANSRKSAATPGQVWLQAAPGDRSAANTMDASIVEGVRYRYVAVRREVVQTGGRALELRSAPTEPVVITWRDIYPPPVPAGLTALGYTVPRETSAKNPPSSAQRIPESSFPKETYAVDLIWQPVNDMRLAGYLVYRQLLGKDGILTGERERLTPQPVSTPGFHDQTALPEARYQYGVTAIDPKGNESAPAEAVAAPSENP